jgi:hypothetical protein
MNEPTPLRERSADQPVRSLFEQLSDELAAIGAEIQSYPGTVRDQKATERLANLLMTPTLRIARDALEHKLGREAVGCEDLDAVATEALVDLHRFLVRRKRKNVVRVMRALTILTRRSAKRYLRRQRGGPDAREDYLTP